MKKMTKLMIILALTSFGIVNHAMPGVKQTAEKPSPSSNFFGTTRITSNTIAQLAPKAPIAIEEQVKAWFATTPFAQKTLLGYEPLVGPMKPFHVDANNFLKRVGVENKSMCNYVFAAVAGHLIKIGGHVNRKENLNMMAGDFGQKYEWGRKLTQEDYQAFDKNLKESQFDKVMYCGKTKVMKTAPKTYQTVSRMAHYLLFQQAKSQGIIAPNIIAPAMYLVHIPGQPKEMSDRNYAIVEQCIDNLQPITSLTSQEAENIKTAIKTIGLFCCSKDNVKRDARGNIVFVDFEQPNNSNPRQFFHTAEWVFKNNANAGLEDFAKHFKTELESLEKASTQTAAAK